MEGFGEQVPATNVEENAPNSRRYRVEAEETTLKYLNKLEVMGNISDIATSYLQKGVSWVEFFEKVAPYIKLPSCDAGPPKQWNSQSEPNQKPKSNAERGRNIKLWKEHGKRTPRL